MSFASPFFLIAIPAWLALAIWLWRGSHPQASVPFLMLWPKWRSEGSGKSARQRPPLSVIALLLAILAGILAAAGPAFSLTTHFTKPITIIVDRGLSMSAQSSDGKPRFVSAAEELDSHLRQIGFAGNVNLKTVPADLSEHSDWLKDARELKPTAVASKEFLELAIRQSLRENQNPIFVLSDQQLAISDDRVTQIVPIETWRNVGIESVSARVGIPEVMVTLRNLSDLSEADLTAKSADQMATQHVSFPLRGQTRNYFLDLRKVDSTVEVTVKAADDPAPNHIAFLASRSAWPKLEIRSPLPADLEKMVRVFSAHRKPNDGSQPIAITTTSHEIPQAAAVIVADGSAGTSVNSNQEPIVAAEPLNVSAVNWRAALGGASIESAPSNWTPIISVGGTVVVAIRTEPARQVWVGFNSKTFSQSVDYVVFWNEVFNWLDPSPKEYSAAIVGQRNNNLMPELIQPDDGQYQAFNAAPVGDLVDGNNPKLRDWQSQLAKRLTSTDRASISAESWFLIAMLTLAMISLLTLSRNSILKGTAQ